MSEYGNATEWLHYYRNCLVDADRGSIQPDERSVFVESLDSISGELALTLMPDVQTPDGKKERALEGPVQIAPFRLNGSVDHGYRAGGAPIYPFWIPAILSASGRLRPPDDDRHMPWFLREVLSPASEQSSSPSLGSIDAYSRALEKYDATGMEWQAFVDTAEKIFADVAGKRWSKFELEGFARTDEFAIVKAELSFATAPLIECYDAFLKGDAELGGLARHYLSAAESKHLRPIPDPASVYLDVNHVGQMSDSFPISDSQRYAMALHLRTRDAEILAVNGPPGTGKTTFLRSVVANLIVEKAVAGDDPPMLLASSTNNQAITNILENFASSEESENPCAGSWVSLGGAVGAYMASSTKAEHYNGAAPMITVSRGEFGGTYIEAIGGIDHQAETIGFLEKLREAFNPEAEGIDSIEDAAEFLRNQLEEEIAFIHSTAAAALWFGESLQDGPDAFTAAENQVMKIRTKQEQSEREVEQANALRDTYLEAQGKVGRKLAAKVSGQARKKRLGELRLRLDSVAPDGFFETITRPDELPTAIAGHIDTCRIAAQKAGEARQEAELHLLQIQRLKARVDGYCSSGAPGAGALRERLASASWYMGIGDALDVTARYSAFLLAQRYWEARWLMSIMNRPGKFSRGKKGRLAFFSEIANLTPLFVCTCHSVPKFLSYSTPGPGKSWRTIPLADFFDLVVMDEAGQVTPEIGLVPFLHGKKGLVVGDVFQIEPIWAITADRVDTANLAQFELVKSSDDYERFKEAGIVACGGSAMAVAQSCSLYRYPADLPVRGSLLREHRRCVDELIHYCNANVYDGQLIPKTGTLAEYKEKRESGHKPVMRLPALGYVNIRGNAQRPASGSRVNPVEAQAVARFVASRQDEIVASYDDKPISELVGIVTPFRAQAAAIRNELERTGVDPDGKIVVGTVHSLQGAERPIVLFSPTYDLKDAGGKMFFDDGWNMMNVAISRAKHHFIVIGEMGRFDARRTDLPSGALAALLFANPENEISPAFFFETTTRFDDRDAKPDGVVRLDTLAKHVKALARAFERADKRLVIVSPFIASHAVEHDGLQEKIENAIAKGVEVVVYTDGFLDTQHGTLRPNAEKGRQAIIDAGATLVVKNGIHNKAIAVDQKILVEGSFNWLSAVRDESSKYHRHEVSIVVQTEKTERFIQDLLESLEATEDGKSEGATK
ncbi:MAG: AAA domain-containing protein [Spirochaetota bacterium]